MQAPAIVLREEEVEGGIVAPKSPLRCAIVPHAGAARSRRASRGAASLRFADAAPAADSDTLTR